MLARLYADLLSLRKENSPLIFDTDLSGNGIINYFPEKTHAIDLSRVADQVLLFDTMLETGNNGKSVDFVVDVSANELNRFFRIFADIGFERGAFEVDLDVHVCYVISWTLKSLKNAEKIRDILVNSKFTTVRNMAIEALPFTPDPQEESQVPNLEIDLYLNALSPEVFRVVNDTQFSFASFIEGNHDDLEYEMRAEIWNFLEDVHNQIRAGI